MPPCGTPDKWITIIGDYHSGKYYVLPNGMIIIQGHLESLLRQFLMGLDFFSWKILG